MADIVPSTAKKVSWLASWYQNGTQLSAPSEFGGLVRFVKLDFTADEEITTSIPVLLARFDRPVRILDLVLKTSSAITTVNIGTTPVSAPVDTVTNIASGSNALASANARATFAGAVGLALSVPSFLIIKPASGSLAAAASLTGHALVIDA